MSSPNPYASPGFVESNEPQRPEPRVGLVLQRTASVLMKVWPVILGASVLLCLPWQMLLSYVTERLNGSSDRLGAMLFLVVLASAGQLTILLFANVLVTITAWRTLQDPSIPGEALFFEAFRGYGNVVASMIIYFFAVNVATMMCLVPGVYLGIRWMYILPIAIAERQSGLALLKQSWELSRHNFGFSLLSFLLFCVPLTIVLVAVSIPGMVRGHGESWLIDPLLIVIGDIAAQMVYVGFVCTYHELLAAQGADAPLAGNEPELVATASASPPRFNA
jgi:hypothetical protein